VVGFADVVKTFAKQPVDRVMLGQECPSYVRVDGYPLPAALGPCFGSFKNFHGLQLGAAELTVQPAENRG